MLKTFCLLFPLVAVVRGNQNNQNNAGYYVAMETCLAQNSNVPDGFFDLLRKSAHADIYSQFFNNTQARYTYFIPGEMKWMESVCAGDTTCERRALLNGIAYGDFQLSRNNNNNNKNNNNNNNQNAYSSSRLLPTMLVLASKGTVFVDDGTMTPSKTLVGGSYTNGQLTYSWGDMDRADYQHSYVMYPDNLCGRNYYHILQHAPLAPRYNVAQMMADSKDKKQGVHDYSSSGFLHAAQFASHYAETNIMSLLTSGTVTVVAPSNSTLAALYGTTDLTTRYNSTQLASWVMAHIFVGAPFYRAQFGNYNQQGGNQNNNKNKFYMCNTRGDLTYLDQNGALGGSVYLPQFTSDIMAYNGVLHIINGVLADPGTYVATRSCAASNQGQGDAYAPASETNKAVQADNTGSTDSSSSQPPSSTAAAPSPQSQQQGDATVPPTPSTTLSTTNPGTEETVAAPRSQSHAVYIIVPVAVLVLLLGIYAFWKNRHARQLYVLAEQEELQKSRRSSHLPQAYGSF